METAEFYIKIGENITKFRNKKGVTVQELANAVEIEKSNLIRITKGRTNPSVGILFKIASVLGVKPYELLK